MRLIIISLCLLNSWICLSQLKVTYSVNFKHESKTQHSSAQHKAIYENTVGPFLNIIRNSDGVLYACDNQSYFSIYPNSKEVELQNVLAKVHLESSSWISNSTEAGNIGRKKKQLIIADYISEPWEIETEEKILLGYSCYKATKKITFKDAPNRNNILEVWFTPDLPIDSGFRDAIGLPGLILYYSNNQWEFEAKNIETLNECNIEIPALLEITYSDAEKEANRRINERKKERNN